MDSLLFPILYMPLKFLQGNDNKFEIRDLAAFLIFDVNGSFIASQDIQRERFNNDV